MEVVFRFLFVVINVVLWRFEKIKYRKNEVFFDVIEFVNLLVSKNKYIKGIFWLINIICL